MLTSNEEHPGQTARNNRIAAKDLLKLKIWRINIDRRLLLQRPLSSSSSSPPPSSSPHHSTGRISSTDPPEERRTNQVNLETPFSDAPLCPQSRTTDEKPENGGLIHNLTPESERFLGRVKSPRKISSIKSKSLSLKKKKAVTQITKERESHRIGNTARVTFADVQESMSTVETAMSSEDEDSKHTNHSHGTEHDDINSMDGCSFTYSPKLSPPNPPSRLTDEWTQGDPTSIPSIHAMESPVSRRRSKRDSRKLSSTTQTRNEAFIQKIRPPLLCDESNHKSTSSDPLAPEGEVETHRLSHVIVSTPTSMSPAHHSESISVARSKRRVRTVDPSASKSRSMSLNPYTPPRRDLMSPLSKAKYSSISRSMTEDFVAPISKKSSLIVLRNGETERKAQAMMQSDAIVSPRQKKKHLSESVSTDNEQVITSSQRKTSTSPRPRKRNTVTSVASEPSVKDRSSTSPRSGATSCSDSNGAEPKHTKSSSSRALSHAKHPPHHGAERHHDVQRSEQDTPSQLEQPTSNRKDTSSMPRRVQSLDQYSGKRRSTKAMEHSPLSKSKNRLYIKKEEGYDDESSRSLLGRVSSSPSSEGSEPPGGESRLIQNGIISQEFNKEAKSSRRKVSLHSISARSMLDRKSRSKSPRPRSSKIGSLPMAEMERRSRSQSPRKSKRQPKSHRNPEKLSKAQIKQQQQRHRVTSGFFPYTRRFDDDDDASEGHFATSSPKVRQSKRALGSSVTCSLEQQRQSVLNAFEKVLAHDQSPFSPMSLAKSSDMCGSQLYEFSRRDSRAIVTLEKTSVTIS